MRRKVVSLLKVIMPALEGGSLVVGGVPVGGLSESMDSELQYCKANDLQEIEIDAAASETARPATESDRMTFPGRGGL